jgi:hypothetical protein
MPPLAFVTPNLQAKNHEIFDLGGGRKHNQKWEFLGKVNPEKLTKWEYLW